MCTHGVHTGIYSRVHTYRAYREGIYRVVYLPSIYTPRVYLRVESLSASSTLWEKPLRREPLSLPTSKGNL